MTALIVISNKNNCHKGVTYEPPNGTPAGNKTYIPFDEIKDAKYKAIKEWRDSYNPDR